MNHTGTIVAVDEESFSAEVLQARLPVLVEFGAPWCPPCRALAPVVESVAREFLGRLKVVSLDADESAALAEQFRVCSIPTSILIKGGEEVGRIQGAVPRAKLVQLVSPHL